MMVRPAPAALLWCLVMCANLKAQAPAVEPPAAAQIRFEFANAGLSPAAYQINLDASGHGTYHSEPGSVPDPPGAALEAFDQQIAVSGPLRDQAFSVARSHHRFADRCEDTRHKVAFTGQKILRYTGPDGQGSCTFNYSQDAQIARLANSFIALSVTLEEGRRLRLAYLHDRLSLDAELETLAVAVRSGSAIELGNIAAELRAIATDGAIMKRAQSRAAALLASVPGAAEQAPSPSR